MKYHVEVEDERLEVRVLEHEGTRWRVSVDGREMLLDVVDGHALVGERSVRFEVRRDEHGEPCGVHLRPGGEVALQVEGLRRAPRKPRAATSARQPQGGSVRAPMNGQVVKVLRAAGDAVGKGDVVLVLEAMKMENEVTTPVAGRLSDLHVQPGVTVKPGDPLFEVDPNN